MFKLTLKLAALALIAAAQLALLLLAASPLLIVSLAVCAVGLVACLPNGDE